MGPNLLAQVTSSRKPPAVVAPPSIRAARRRSTGPPPRGCRRGCPLPPRPPRVLARWNSPPVPPFTRVVRVTPAGREGGRYGDGACWPRSYEVTVRPTGRCEGGSLAGRRIPTRTRGQ